METWFENNRKDTRARIHEDNNVGARTSKTQKDG